MYIQAWVKHANFVCTCKFYAQYVNDHMRHCVGCECEHYVWTSQSVDTVSLVENKQHSKTTEDDFLICQFLRHALCPILM